MRSTISRSMSVALSASLPGSARSNTFDSIGIVVRRSTTLCTWPSAFKKAARSMVSFILATQELPTPAPPPPGHAQGRSAPPPRRSGSTGQHYSTIGYPPQHPLLPRMPYGRSALQHPAQQLDIFGERRVGARQLFDLAHRMHDGGVITAAELAADLRQRSRRQLLGQIHCDLTRAGDGAGAAIGGHLAQFDIEVFGDLFLDFVDSNPSLVRAEQIVQHLLDALERDIAPHQLDMRGDSVQRPFEVSNIRGDLVCEKLHHLRRNPQATLLGLRLQYAEAQFISRRVQISDESPAEPRAHALLHTFEVGGRFVGRDHDLAVLVDQCIKGMEEFLLRRFLADDELHIIDHQKIDRAKLFLEVHRRLEAQCSDELVHELFGRKIDYFTTAGMLADVPSDGVHQVCLAEPDPAIQKQRIERHRGTRTRASLSDAPGRGMSEFVGLADDEILKNEAVIESQQLRPVVTNFERQYRSGRRR